MSISPSIPQAFVGKNYISGDILPIILTANPDQKEIPPMALGSGLKLLQNLPSNVIAELCKQYIEELGTDFNKNFEAAAQFEKSGILRHLPFKNSFFVEPLHESYSTIRKEDLVLGTVTNAGGDNLLVDCGGLFSHSSLNILSFDGASKKNHPNLNIGDAVYGRIKDLRCNQMEPEMTCCAPNEALRRDWVTDQALFGELGKQTPQSSKCRGITFNLDCRFCRFLLQKKCWLLEMIARKIPFEIAVGMNGKVWINHLPKKKKVEVTNEKMQKNEDKNKDKVMGISNFALFAKDKTGATKATEEIEDPAIEDEAFKKTVIIYNILKKAQYLSKKEQCESLVDQLCSMY